MNKEEIKKGRYPMHVLLGFLLGYVLYIFMTNHVDLGDWKYLIPGSNIDFGFLFTTALICFIAILWDGMQEMFFGGKFDWNDVWASTLGGFLATIFALIIGDNNWVFYGFMITGLIIVYREVRPYKLKNQKLQ